MFIKARILGPLTAQEVKTFLKHYENVDFLSNKQKKEFFIKFINKVILYDNRIITVYNTTKDPQKEVDFKDNNIGEQTPENDNLNPVSGEFEGKNKDDSNALSSQPQSVEIKNDCKDNFDLQSIFGGNNHLLIELNLLNLIIYLHLKI